MTLNEYQLEQMRTAPLQHYKVHNDILTNTALGLAGEAGEFADILKKSLYQGHELDKAHLIKELGDVLWYVSLGATACGVELEEVARQNVEKLRKRYPDGFEDSRSINRAKGDI